MAKSNVRKLMYFWINFWWSGPESKRIFFEIDPEVSLILSTHMAREPLSREAQIRSLKWKWITSSMCFSHWEVLNLGQGRLTLGANITCTFSPLTPLHPGNRRSSTRSLQNWSQMPRDSNMIASLIQNVPTPPTSPLSLRPGLSYKYCYKLKSIELNLGSEE